MSGLGKGLDALIPSGSEDITTTGVNEVKTSLIDVNPHQPRTIFDEDGLSELTASIKKHGVLQPLVVTPKGDHFELIAGERRLRASKKAGLDKVPVIIRDAKEHEKLEIAIIENVHRSDLNPMDEAVSYRKLTEEFGYTQDKISEIIGKSRATISNKIRLLSLPVDIKKAIKDGEISEGHAKALLGIEDPNRQRAMFEEIISSGLNVRDVERRAKHKNQNPKNENAFEPDLVTRQLADDLKTFLGAKVAIKNTAKGGKIEIDYYSQEELARIYQKIKGID